MQIKEITILGEGKGKVTIEYLKSEMAYYEVLNPEGGKQLSACLFPPRFEKDPEYRADSLKAAKDIFRSMHSRPGTRKDIAQIRKILAQFWPTIP